MFAEEEIEALALGIRWVADRADGALGAAAQNALAKIAAVLPPDLRDRMDASALLVGPGEPIVGDGVDLAVVRRAIRGERKLSIAYRDRDGPPASASSGPLLSASSTGCASWSRGASCAGRSAISAPTASSS